MTIGTRLLMGTHIFLYRISGGRVGSKMAGQSVLLLNTVGRKSGKRYTTPINYYTDKDRYVVVASNWGSDHHPSWYYNLLHQPAATIQVKGKLIAVSASLSGGEEYDRLWGYVTKLNDFYVRYQQQTRRKIPLVILTPG
ncbi:MAG TPA: nitroreductase/quinone reductase family protein [Anaerolineaceae bacterium]